MYQLSIYFVTRKIIFLFSDNYDYLKRRFLCEMSSADHSPLIQDWDIGGKVLLDYINTMQTLEQLRLVSMLISL